MNQNLGKLDDRSFLNFIIRIVDESTLIIGEFILYNKIWALTKDLTSRSEEHTSELQSP